MASKSKANTIVNELDWFQNLLTLRTKITFERSIPEEEFLQMHPPDLKDDDSPYAQCIRDYKMGFEERLVLILALIPHVRPSLLDILHLKNTLYDIPFTEFGGVGYERHKGFLPTGETAMFLLAGENLEKRLASMALFSNDHFFSRAGILSLEHRSTNEPISHGVLTMSKEYVSKLILGKEYQPDFGAGFPAKRIFTLQEETDLVADEAIKRGLADIKSYIQNGKRLKNEYQFGNKILPGYKVLFSGPPGTGKTLSAMLLGKSTGMEVYRIDLSQVVSKYIGETEKNLSQVFNMAQNKNWILFFDEADALFGKRSDVSDSHDRYANQEVSFLLQRMEDFDGLVILCSNLKKNIDEAFFRRFHLVLDFTMPTVQQRFKLWQASKTQAFEYDSDIDIAYLAETYELSAASIINVLHYSILKCLENGGKVIKADDLEMGISLEISKKGEFI